MHLHAHCYCCHSMRVLCTFAYTTMLNNDDVLALLTVIYIYIIVYTDRYLTILNNLYSFLTLSLSLLYHQAHKLVSKPLLISYSNLSSIHAQCWTVSLSHPSKQ
jgi:hypothetical protein